MGSMAFVSPKNTPPKKMLRHVVLFKFKDSATPAQVKEVEDAFRALPSKIKEVKGFEWGNENSPEGLSQGFTHIFFVTFNSEEDRAVYLPHPEHKAFVKVLEPHLDKVLVVDYWTKE
ncbi:Dabb family protein [Dyadobacter sp. CY312]|nr:Dabb family protein [Dyadobacter sp. CY312]MCE7044303.1 Dabb family protein [Dyadobacter sp. CY312]